MRAAMTKATTFAVKIRRFLNRSHPTSRLSAAVGYVRAVHSARLSLKAEIETIPKNATVLIRITARRRSEETYFGLTTDSSHTFNFTFEADFAPGWASTTMA